MTEKAKKIIKRTIIWTVVSVFVSTLIVAQVITAVELKKNFKRGSYGDKELTARWFYDHYEKDYPRSEKIAFKSGKNTLYGYVYGEKNTKGLIVFAHGIGGGHESYLDLILGMVDRGWRVFAYDATGSCESEGKGTKGLSQSALDLNEALKYVENDAELSKLPLFVMGHSWGGFASAAVLNFDHPVKAVVSFSGYYKPTAELFEEADRQFPKSGILLHPFIRLTNFVTFGKYSGLSAVKGINKSGIPVLICHGNDDKMISLENSSIMSQKDKITNPNVEYHLWDKENRNGHNSWMYEDEYFDYIEIMQPKADALNAQYEGQEMPREVIVDWYKNVLDGEKMNGIHPEVLEMTANFFSKNL
ncbi:MAG: lysophospholipase [Treponema sp.]|nr:lysophospholipase [Treponema sp.]